MKLRKEFTEETGIYTLLKEDTSAFEYIKWLENRVESMQPDTVHEEWTDDDFHAVANEIEKEWDMAGLAGTVYEDFARACYNRFVRRG